MTYSWPVYIVLALFSGLLTACGTGFMYPLHQAAAQGDQATARLLIDRGDNVNEKNVSGWTPLMTAAFAGNVRITTMLLEHGADPALTNTAGQTALDLARQQDHTLVSELLERRLAQQGTR